MNSCSKSKVRHIFYVKSTQKACQTPSKTLAKVNLLHCVEPAAETLIKPVEMYHFADALPATISYHLRWSAARLGSALPDFLQLPQTGTPPP